MIQIGFAERVHAGELITIQFRAARPCKSIRLWFADDTATGLMLLAGTVTSKGADPLVMGAGPVSARFFALPGDGKGGRPLPIDFEPGRAVELLIHNVDSLAWEARGVLELYEERAPSGSMPDATRGGRYLPAHPPLEVTRLGPVRT